MPRFCIYMNIFWPWTCGLQQTACRSLQQFVTDWFYSSCSRNPRLTAFAWRSVRLWQKMLHDGLLSRHFCQSWWWKLGAGGTAAYCSMFLPDVVTASVCGWRLRIWRTEKRKTKKKKKNTHRHSNMVHTASDPTLADPSKREAVFSTDTLRAHSRQGTV